MIHILLVSLAAAAWAAPAELPAAPLTKSQQIPIVSLENNVNFDGSYKYSFEGGDGTRAIQEGSLKQVGQDVGESAQGSYSYVGDDGRNYAISYTADENGYRPQGDHLPQPPPIPEEIAKSLAFLATKAPTKEDLEGQYTP
ncbi:endocuticle structural glycoprotein SgAbd-3-like [Macrosteles quadrilineatus]|uniref:endocuticle structural glycoprotein SgAbd-3-like n=1 Tax=Macrosteles quadrilineatus TaxID=74068 RepID=UPI0023E19EEE|nr:endocuticle structural glycoprotein SgAbd-3-like [Macrosteles quadrilineatus]